ncbi:GNAT family N-acetyltransferase [Burkholderia sp. USMB20]|uniref:GNAT family N-acetyltransferase n=1 Tax=Burkholderia sp. USMB20 TaxID=1571773 RepID=UPI003FA4CC7B
MRCCVGFYQLRLEFRSEPHPGYPEKWLDLWQQDLEISPEVIEGSIGYVAEAEGTVIGFWIRTPADSDRPTPGWLFVHPEHMGRRIARALWEDIRKEAARR